MCTVHRRGVRRPELIIARSAHAAYYKAAEYFKMRLITLPVDKDWRLSGGVALRTGGFQVLLGEGMGGSQGFCFLRCDPMPSLSLEQHLCLRIVEKIMLCFVFIDEASFAASKPKVCQVLWLEVFVLYFNLWPHLPPVDGCSKHCPAHSAPFTQHSS
eukprot:1145985-Pelagomonas_calceolata.AAC.1